MLKPVNNHILIEPLKHESFIASQKGTYEEVGTVIEIPLFFKDSFGDPYIDSPVEIGDKVYFDSWLASKFPKNDKEFFWLVSWSDIKAIEHANKVSE